MPTTLRILLAAATGLCLGSCERDKGDAGGNKEEGPRSVESPSRLPFAGKSSPRPGTSAAAMKSLRSLSSLPKEEQAPTLFKRIYDVPDADLDLVLETVRQQDDPDTRAELLATLYDETQLRSPVARLPLVLEIARDPYVAPSLKTTIMAELGRTLETEHGNSWAEWAQALEDHLANTSGLLRVDASE